MAMAAATALAFLLRHDHGLFLAAGGVLTAWLAHEESSAGARARPVAEVGLATLTMLVSYLVFVQINGGLWS
jgi:hypothetical protein